MFDLKKGAGLPAEGELRKSSGGGTQFRSAAGNWVSGVEPMNMRPGTPIVSPYDGKTYAVTSITYNYPGVHEVELMLMSEFVAKNTLPVLPVWPRGALHVTIKNPISGPNSSLSRRESLEITQRAAHLAKSLKQALEPPLGARPVMWSMVDTTNVFDALTYLERLLDTPLKPWAEQTVNLIQGIRRTKNAEFSRLYLQDGELIVQVRLTIPSVANFAEVTLTL